ncbi:MAG: DNA repair protein RadA [Actinomycetota bacterium]|nr:DNA repair protein RadA [Actinomycetota bacterium]
MATSTRNASVCSGCGYRTFQWVGKCPQCGAWDSFSQERSASPIPTLLSLSAVDTRHEERFVTGIDEFDRVLGGGVVPGSLVLLAGEPGVGKSTLTLQVARCLESSGRKVLLVCAEESVEQVARRDKRLGLGLTSSVTDTTDVRKIVDAMPEVSVLIVDSVQMLIDPDRPGEAGSVGQVRAVTSALAAAARIARVAVILVGHITKDGSVAGPRALEHLVDAVVVFEGDRSNALRSLRAVKNRFGPSGEVGVFEMTTLGLNEVADPSALALQHGAEPLVGCAVGCTIEGRRPRSVEIQSLIAKEASVPPRRVAEGIDSSRIGLMLAVLSNRGDCKVMGRDCFVRVSGGLRVSDPALDLAICLCIASSYRDKALPRGVAAVAEVGLAGELRDIPGLDVRINELFRLGFERVIAPFSASSADARVSPVKTVKEAMSLVL